MYVLPFHLCSQSFGVILQLSTLHFFIFVSYFCQADPYYQHQYHHQYHHHHHQYHYPPAGSAPPDAGQYGLVNDGNEIQGDETEPKPLPKKLPKPPKSAFVLFSEFKHEEREKSGEAICKKVSRKRNFSYPVWCRYNNIFATNSTSFVCEMFMFFQGCHCICGRRLAFPE